MKIGFSNGDFYIAGRNSSDAVLAKVDATGKILCERKTANSVYSGVTLDIDGDVYSVGERSGDALIEKWHPAP